MKKLCIFDLDGTLASTLESMAVAANRVLREMNLPEQPTESFKYFAGDGAKELCRRCLRAAGDAECSQYEEMYRKYREYFSETCMYKVVPYEGIPELLEKLKAAGHQNFRPFQQAPCPGGGRGGDPVWKRLF